MTGRFSSFTRHVREDLLIPYVPIRWADATNFIIVRARARQEVTIQPNFQKQKHAREVRRISIQRHRKN